MTTHRAEDRLFIVHPHPINFAAAGAGDDLDDCGQMILAEIGRRLDPDAFVVPLDDVADVREPNPRIFLEHPLGGDAELLGTLGNLLNRGRAGGMRRPAAKALISLRHRRAQFFQCA
jgi:hypothetical protein